MQVFRRSSMVEQEAVNFEVAGSSPAVGAKKNPLAFIASGFFFVLNDQTWTSNSPVKLAVVAGSIARSKTEKFTFMDATTVRSCPAVGAKNVPLDEGKN